MDILTLALRLETVQRHICDDAFTGTLIERHQ